MDPLSDRFPSTTSVSAILVWSMTPLSPAVLPRHDRSLVHNVHRAIFMEGNKLKKLRFIALSIPRCGTKTHGVVPSQSRTGSTWHASYTD
jgi:hypothetical protein